VVVGARCLRAVPRRWLARRAAALAAEQRLEEGAEVGSALAAV